MRPILIGLSLYTLCLTPAIAQDDSYSIISLLTNDSEFEQRYVNDEQKMWRNSIQNDALTGDNITDQYFTNALRVSAYANVREGFLFDGLKLYGFKCGPDDDGDSSNDAHCDSNPRANLHNRDLKLVQYGYTMGHDLYTPYQDAGKGFVDEEGYEHIENAYYYDRPYAAWAYAGRTLKITGIDGYIDQKLTIGSVGPRVRGRGVQETAHRYPFSGADPITGWETQVHNRLALQYEGKFAQHLIRPQSRFSSWYVSHFPYLELGTVINRVGYGLESKVSLNNNQHCDSYQSSELFYIDTVAQRQLSIEEKLRSYSQQLRWYLNAGNYLPRASEKSMLKLIERLDNTIRRDHIDSATAYRELEHAQRTLDELNRRLAKRVIRQCFPTGWYVNVHGSITGHYVISNYLLDDGIHVPRNSDPDSEFEVMRNGGHLSVTPKRLIGSASFGIMAGWQDSWGIGFNYHYRSEETREQQEQHRWAELVVEGRGEWVAAFIPILIGSLSLYRYDEWP